MTKPQPERADDLRQAQEALDTIDAAVLALTGDINMAEDITRKYHQLAETLTDPDGYLPEDWVEDP